MTTPLLIQHLSENATKRPNKLALSFLRSGSNGGVVEKKMKYQDVINQTQTLAANLSLRGLKKNDL